jgi:hypothetical protein
MKGFRDALTETGKAYPHLDVAWEEIHERWIEHLGRLGLDPELFRYQREMNADEGEAAGLFAVKNDSDFTDLLLRAVTDTRDTDGLADLVHGFAHKLGRRAELTAERDFTAGSLELLTRLTDTAAGREAARGVHTQSERRTRALAGRLAARGAAERERAQEFGERLAAAGLAVTEAERGVGHAARTAAELAYRHASLALTAAEQAATAQRRELSDARTLQAAWQAAETVLQHRAAADRSARVAAAIREAERDAAPALAARAQAAAALIRALLTAARDSERVASEHEDRSAALQEAAETAHRDATAAATEAQRARSDGEHLRQRLTEVEEETAQAVGAGWLEDSGPHADPARAALAASDAEQAAASSLAAATDAARRTQDRARQAAADHAQAELAAARAADAARAAESAWSAEHETAAALASDDRLTALLGLPPAGEPDSGTVDAPPAAAGRDADATTVDGDPAGDPSATAGTAGAPTGPAAGGSSRSGDDPQRVAQAAPAPDGPAARADGRPRDGSDGTPAARSRPARRPAVPRADATARPDAETASGRDSAPGPDTRASATPDAARTGHAAAAPPHGGTGRPPSGRAGRGAERDRATAPPGVGPGARADGRARAGRPPAPLTADDLDRDAEALGALLDERVAEAERRLFELRTAAADDSRVLAALGDGGLLPPGPDVLATVEFLAEHGIPALPGWRYLAQAVPPADHARVLAARPELVDGIVITDPDSHARAREVIAAAALLPRSAVAVGTTAALLAPTPPPGGRDSGVFLVPPNPAMHDERAADDERRALRERAADRDQRIRGLAARLADDRRLAARLASWRAGCPAGGLAELAAASAHARTEADAARQRLDEASAARAETEQAAAEAAAALDQRQDAVQRARRSADALAGLASRLRERPRWRARLSELAQEAAEADERAAQCLALARATDEDRRAAQRAADDARRTARALRAERAEISGIPAEAAAPAGAAPAEPAAPAAAQPSLPALREAYRAAGQLYEKVGVGADLRAEQARAEGDESAARAALDRLSSKVRTRAARLLDGTEGADGPSRQAAAARAEALVHSLESRAATASEQLGRLRGEAERLAPAEGETHIELPADRVPADAARARELLREAAAGLAARESALAAARATHEDLFSDHRLAQDAADGFDETAALLKDLLREPQQRPAADTGPQQARDDGGPAPRPPDAYPGGLPEARQDATAARRELRERAAALAAAEAAVREAADRLVRHANATRYQQVRTPARQQIRELPAAALPDHATAWSEAFAPRLRVLADELTQLERNRDGIVDRLRGLVESSLDTLRAAQRLSRLPEGLGEWSGQEFLRIRFDDPDQATLTERLGEVVDETTRAAVAKNADLRRDGMSLLLRGVRAALQPRGVSVEILKPDAVLRAERVPVGQMGDVFSGGQLLTAAIALYCTMAALRGNDRGRERHRHAGTLFLDNPIGRANATYLLELQRAVADALGVQLLYTTGLFDTTALAEFPLVIRLRNDADLRAGLKYISVEEHLRPGLPRQDPEAEPTHGEITATRVFRRPAP